MQDAVLRMLVDKYKPLRSGTIQTAEQKLKLTPPSVSSSVSSGTVTRLTVPATGSWATKPLLPSSPDHRPWHTEFRAPSHATSSIKEAYIPPAPARPAKSIPIDDAARRKERETKRKAEYVGRLTRAKESTLDYRLGIRNSIGRLHPASLKGWANLVEDKIEVNTFFFSFIND
jgi:DnaJ family protein C protein 28